MSNDRIECRYCGESGPVGAILPGLCPVGRGGVHEPHDMFGPLPAVTKTPPTPEVSEAARTMAARRRGALAAGKERAQKAGDKQEKESPGWFTAAIEHVIAFGRQPEQQAKGFLMEEAAVYAYAHGLPEPAEKRSWGHIPRKMQKESPGRRLERIGFDTDGFGSPKSRWRIV